MKGLKITAAIALGLTLAAVISCGGENEAPATTPTPIANSVNVDASYDGSNVTLEAGELLIVTLDSNMTTGFSWNLSSISNTAVIQKVSDEYIAPEPTDPPIVGQGGQEVWTFEALASGSSMISMKYVQPWMPDAEPAVTFDIIVIVE